MPKYDPERLASELNVAELNERVSGASERIEQRTKRIQDEERDMMGRERDLFDQDRAELVALRDALSIREMREEEDISRQLAERSRQLDAAMGQGQATRAAGELRAHFRTAEQRALAGEGYRFGLGEFAAHLELHQRSTTTALAGATHAVAAGVGDTAGGIWLPRESGGMNLRLNPGERLEAGVWPANSATAATGEGATKPTLDPSSLGTDTVSPFAVTSNVTIQSAASGRGVEQFTWAGTRKVRRSVNDAFTGAMVTAGGTARAFDTDVVTSVDGAISEMMATTATVPTLVVVDPGFFSALATAGGDDARDAFPAFRGIRLVSSAVTGLADHALVIDGSAITYSMSGVEVRTQPQVISNSTDMVVEVWFAAVAYGASGVTLQDLTAA